MRYICNPEQESEVLNITIPEEEQILVNYITYIPLGYSIPTIVIQAIMVYVLCRPQSPKIFKEGFYRIVMFSLIAGIVILIFLPFMTRFTDLKSFIGLYKWLMDKPFLVSTIISIIFYAYYSLSLSILAIAFNRYSLLAWPLKSRTWWQDNTYKVILTIYISPFLLAWPVYYAGGCVQAYNGGYRLDYYVRSVPIFLQQQIVLVIVVFITTSLSTYFNVYVVYHLIKSKNTKAKEMKLAIYAALLGICELLFIIIQVCFGITMAMEENAPKIAIHLKWMLRIVPFLADGICGTQSWFLLAMSSDIRKQLRYIRSQMASSVLTKTTIRKPLSQRRVASINITRTDDPSNSECNNLNLGNPNILARIY